MSQEEAGIRHVTCYFVHIIRNGKHYLTYNEPFRKSEAEAVCRAFADGGKSKAVMTKQVILPDLPELSAEEEAGATS